jgi:N-acylneuraminate cytidylyltransferase
LETLFLIPARAGSKGLPHKNIKLLGNKELISYTIEFALENKSKDDIICITTDDARIIEIAKSNYGISVPFERPAKLSSDNSSTFDVIIHALNYYKSIGIYFEKILLLQPTSPFRTVNDFISMNEIYEKTSADMVVSVKKSKESPYFTLFEEDKLGKLKKIISNSTYLNRQECPPVYVYNGSMYLVNVSKFLQKRNFNFENIIKYEMPESRSVDIDTKVDWILAEYYQNINNENS